MADNSKTDPFFEGSSSDVATSAFDWLGSFGKSAIESIPELVGITPSTETMQWRQDNPWSGFGSEVVGTAVPYLGWFKAAKVVTRFSKAVEALGSVEKPFAQGVLQNAAMFAPFEAGRLATSQVVGDKSFGEMLGDTTFNLAIGSGLGGVLHGIAAAGTRDPKLATIFPGIDIAAPLPLQARHMKEIIGSGKLVGEDLDRANGKLLETLRAARTEELPSNLSYVAPIDHMPGANNEDLRKQLNRLFRPKEGTEERLVQTRKFAEGVERDFPSRDAWNKAAEEGALAQGFEDKGQFFRHVSFDPKAESMVSAKLRAQTIDNKLTKNMESVGDGTFITREADDGMFVIARKTNGKPGLGDQNDRWLLFKTDQPGTFVPDAQRWANTMVEKLKWNPTANIAADGGSVYNSSKNFIQEFPLRNYRAMAKDPSGIAGVIEKFIPQEVRGKQNEVVARLGEAMREYLAPRIHQFKKSWRGNWIVNAAKATYDSAENATQQILNGHVKTDPGKNLFFQGLQNEKQGFLDFQPVRDMVNALPEEQFQTQFGKMIWREELTADKLSALQQQGLISPEIAKFATELERIDKYVTGSINKAETAVGHKPTEWRAGHYGLGRHWDGDTRVIVRNDSGETVAVAGGANRKLALNNAQQLVKDNPGWHIPENAEFSLSQGFPKELDPIVKSPSFLLERQNIRGFKFDQKPFTKKEFLDSYENSLRARMKYQANLATDDLLGPAMHSLQREDPAVFRQVESRMMDYAGVQTAFGKWQNKVTDQILGPMLGTNSATKIVQTTNTAFYNFQLGALKLSYPIVNALQFVQTVIPEAAFIMGKAPPETLAGMYSFFAAGGSKGPVGSVGALSPLKLMYKSMAEMRKPTAELSAAFERAVNDRVIDPRLVENYIGESSIAVKDFGKVLKGEGNFTEWLRAVSEFLPANTERLSRTHSFTVGYMIGRDFLKKEGQALNPEQLYNFAKQFTENTMYLYSAADKPRVFTTPAGSLMGLFKNWMMHYMASMGEYAKEGFTKNNWSPLLWQTTGTFSLGGLSATPLWWAADGFSKMWSGKGAMENAYEQFGQQYGDAVLLGLPAAITGVSLYSSVNSPVSNPTRDASTMFSMVAWDRVKQLGKLGGAAMDNWQATGEHPAHNQGIRELMARVFAPTTLYRTMSAMAEPGQITQLGTGYPQMKNASAADRILYSFGFNPTELDRGQAVSQELYADHKKMQARVKSLGDAWADAEVNGNSPQMAIIMRQAITWGVDVSKVLSEGMKNLQKHQKDIIERQLKPGDLAAYRRVLSVHRGLEE